MLRLSEAFFLFLAVVAEKIIIGILRVVTNRNIEILAVIIKRGGNKMGTYYNAREVIQRGTKIIPYESDRRPSVREGEVLVGILNNGVFAIAPDVTSESEFKQFYGDYWQGFWLGMDVYALPKSELPNCQDNGRVSFQDLEKILKEHPPRTETRF